VVVLVVVVTVVVVTVVVVMALVVVVVVLLFLVESGRKVEVEVGRRVDGLGGREGGDGFLVVGRVGS